MPKNIVRTNRGRTMTTKPPLADICKKHWRQPMGLGVAQQRCFVFGSNREGRHGKGAARTAWLYHGAAYGVAEGPTGKAYAIPTKELRKGKPPVTIEEIRAAVVRFLAYAHSHPEIIFTVADIGCGLAGFTPKHIAPLFLHAPNNVRLSATFQEVLKVCKPT